MSEHTFGKSLRFHILNTTVSGHHPTAMWSYYYAGLILACVCLGLVTYFAARL